MGRSAKVGLLFCLVALTAWLAVAVVSCRFASVPSRAPVSHATASPKLAGQARGRVVAPAPSASVAQRLPCMMGGPNVQRVEAPPSGWYECGASDSGAVSLWVPSADDCLSPLHVRAGTPVRFVSNVTAEYDLDDDGDIDLHDYAVAQCAWEAER